MAKRINPDARYDEIVAAALGLAADGHYQTVTREQVADAAQCSPGLVSRYLGTMDELRDVLVREAVTRRVLRVIAQAAVAGHPYAVEVPAWLREKALTAVTAGG